MKKEHHETNINQSIDLHPLDIGIDLNVDWDGWLTIPQRSDEMPLGAYRTLNEIQNFVTLVSETDCLGVSVNPRARGSRLQKESTPLTRYSNKILFWNQHCCEKFQYSYEIDAFLRACRKIGITKEWPAERPELFDVVNGRPWYQIFNQLVLNLRAIVRSTDYRKQLASRSTRIDRNRQSAVDLIERLFEKRSRLLIVRVDLGYDKNENVGIDQVKQDRQRLFNNLRHNQIFKGLLGVIWKLEFGFKRGLHYHLIFIFDGALRRQDASIGGQIGDYWKELVRPPSHPENQHYAYSSNKFKQRFAECGIGMIQRDDEEKRGYLTDNVVGYLCKKDNFLVVKSTAREQTFGAWSVN